MPFRKQVSNATLNYPFYTRRSFDERPVKELESILIKFAVDVQTIKQYDDVDKHAAAATTSRVKRRRKKSEVQVVP